MNEPAIRFADWPRFPARVVLLATLALLALAALAAASSRTAAGPSHCTIACVAAEGLKRDADLALYDAIIARVAAGDDYYTAAIAEQRARGFPVRPGLAVRLPTLATISAIVGKGGLLTLAAALGLGTLLAWWIRLGREAGGRERRPVAILLLLVGTAAGLKPQYLALHEVWAGMFMALSFALHRARAGRPSIGAFAAAACALAIRETALPFVLLLFAMAVWRRHWAGAAAWAALILVFAAALIVHLGIVAEHVLPADRPSPPWLVLRGLSGFTSNAVLSSSLHLLPGWVAAPLALLPLFGWAAWRSEAGALGTFLFGGYALLFMLAGRENNFYWALLITPAYFVGLAFVPAGLAALWRRALGKGMDSLA